MEEAMQAISVSPMKGPHSRRAAAPPRPSSQGSLRTLIFAPINQSSKPTVDELLKLPFKPLTVHPKVFVHDLIKELEEER